LRDHSNKKKDIHKDIDIDAETAAEDLKASQTEAAVSGDVNIDEASNLDPVTIKMQELAQEAALDRDRLLRLSAEFENYKKRMSRQMDDFKKYANEVLLKDLLTIVDNLERAATPLPGAAAKESVAECVREGVELTLHEIIKILNRHHVAAIDAMNQPFDPAYHEAVMQEPSDDYPENTVINVFQKGYMIHDRLLRPAMVVVSKKNA